MFTQGKENYVPEVEKLIIRRSADTQKVVAIVLGKNQPLATLILPSKA